MDDRPDGRTCWGPGTYLTILWWGFAALFVVLGIAVLLAEHALVDRLFGLGFVLVPGPVVAYALRRRRLWVTADEVVVRTVLRRTQRFPVADVTQVLPAKSWVLIKRAHGRGVTASVPPTEAMLAALDR